jgi:thiol-disulfide isomerase/thioredoxin
MVFSISVAGNGYKIRFRIDAAADSFVYLTHYLDTNVYAMDTVKADGHGNGLFRGDTLLHQGLYKFYMNKNQHFDFLVGADQTIEIISPDFSLENIQIKDSNESSEFLTYMKWLKQQQGKLSGLDSQYQKATGQDKENLDKEIRKLTEEVQHYWKQKSEEFPGTFLAAFLMANYLVELKESDIPAAFLKTDSLKWTYEYNFRKNHFFDYFDITDERFLYTPIIKSKLDTYLDKVLLQIYDSVKPAAYQLIHKVESHPVMFRYMISYLLNHALSSRVMGMDALFVDIGRDYYLSGKATWADSTTLSVVKENVTFMSNNLMGKIARNLQMETFGGETYFLCQGNSKYTILVFYEPTCSHCKEFIPRLYDEIYLPYRNKGLEVVAIYMQNNRKEWKEFMDEHHLNDWVNIWNPVDGRFKVIFDTRTTPAVYLLDKDKKIIAKKFSIDFLKNYFSFYLDGKKAE